MGNKGKYTEFKEAVWQAIGTRSQKEFADAAGISPAHLSRFLSADIIGQPSRKMLSRMVKAMPNVTIGQLYAMCGYNDEAIALGVASPVSEHDNRVLLSIATREDLNFEDLQNAFTALTVNARLFPSLAAIFDEINVLYAAEDLNFRILFDFENPSGVSDRTALVEFVWTAGEMRSSCFLLLDYAVTVSGKVLPVAIRFSGKELAPYKDKLPVEMLSGFKRFGVYINDLPHVFFTRRISAEERLLDVIFGSGNEEMVECVTCGIGFYTEPLPPHYDEFLQKHEGCLKHSLSELRGSLVMEDICEEIAGILSHKMGVSAVYYHAPSNNPYGNQSCIMIPDDEAKEDEAIKLLYDHAKELGVKRIQTIYFKHKIAKDVTVVDIK